MSGLSLQGLPYDITRLMLDHCYVSKRQTPTSGQGTGYAKPIYGPSLIYQCRVSHRTQMIRSISGEYKVSSAQVWFASELDISPDDKIILPGDSEPTPIMHIDVSPNEYGDYLQKVYL